MNEEKDKTLKNEAKEKDKAIVAAKAELKREAEEKSKAKVAEQNKVIKEIQKKKNRTGDDKLILGEAMKKRAKANAELPRDLSKLYPSQMTMDEMLKYCEENKIEVLKGDTTVMLRTRIKAFRNPAFGERLAMLEDRRVTGKIVK